MSWGGAATVSRSQSATSPTSFTVSSVSHFAVGCVMIFAMAMVLYSSAVNIPQLAQTVLGYTATWAGLILSPGALLVCLTIPIVGKIMPYIQTRYMIAIGFFLLGGSLVYSHGLTPDIDFKTLTLMRAAQSFGLAFLFVPISTIAYSTLPKELNGDAAALFTMFRNLAGSIGISAATALVTERTQVRTAHLVGNLNPFNQQYNQLVDRQAHTMLSQGFSPGGCISARSGWSIRRCKRRHRFSPTWMSSRCARSWHSAWCR
jgi:MFS transporter, DHA2 family, multidrug resistance protein